MAAVTYLLGAGASANCLPTYINFEKRFQRFKNFFSTQRGMANTFDESQRSLVSSVHQLCKGIEEEFQYHNTPDTIAKKYFHSELNDSKEIMILFFLFQQILKQTEGEKSVDSILYRQSMDKRYDAFIAALLKPAKRKLQLHDQFKILTWNYDLQFEIAFSRYLNKRIPYCQNMVQSFPKIIDDGSRLDLQKFCILHLNGIAYARCDESTSFTDYLGDFIDENSTALEYLSQVYKSLHTTGNTGKIGGSELLSFAWEKQNEDSSIIDNELLRNATAIAKSTEVLIIIGYSFPIFNNAIDKLIFKEMPNLKKIYIQSPSGSDIKNIIKSDIIENNMIEDRDIIDLKYWNQFHVPAEWNKDYSITDYTGVSFR